MCRLLQDRGLELIENATVAGLAPQSAEEARTLVPSLQVGFSIRASDLLFRLTGLAGAKLMQCVLQEESFTDEELDAMLMQIRMIQAT